MHLEDEEKNLDKFLRPGTPSSVKERYLSLKSIADISDFEILDTNLVVVDTESTGLSIAKDDLIQIAAAKIEKGKIKSWYTTFVNPDQAISDEIVHLTHISNADVVGAPSPNMAVKGLVDFCENSVILAHNINFDRSILTKYDAGFKLLDNIWVDTLDLSRIAFPRLTSHRLIDLTKAFSITESTHRADDDVYSTFLIYRLILSAISLMPLDLVSTIADIAPLDIWGCSYVFYNMLKSISYSSYSCLYEKINNDIDYKENCQYQHCNSSHNIADHLSMLKNMRKYRLKEIPTQKKYDVEVENVCLSGSSNVIQTESMQFPMRESLEHDFSESGVLGKIYKDYEPRQEQTQMANCVLESFKEKRNLIIEAGTGIGKSLAYLIPAIRTAINNHIIIGIATKTNALLDQLVYKELPRLAQYFDGLAYCSIKGAQNYICLRKALELCHKKASIKSFRGQDICGAASIATLLSYIEQTANDDCDGLKVDKRALNPKSFTSSSHECWKHKCPFFKNGCFSHFARSVAENSDIVVTNQTMMLCNVNADWLLLPSIRYWIIDEAHNLEDEARDIFCETISASLLLDFSKKLSSDKSTINLFTQTQKKLNTIRFDHDDNDCIQKETYIKGSKDISVAYGLLSSAKNASIKLCKSCEQLAKNLNFILNVTNCKKSYQIQEIWIDDHIRDTEEFKLLYNYAKQFCDSCDTFLIKIAHLISYLEDYKICSSVIIPFCILIYDLKKIYKACDKIFFNVSSRYVYSAKLDTKKSVYLDCYFAQLLNVGDDLQNKFYSCINSAVFTSATLSVGGSFLEFKKSVGLDFDNTDEIILKSSFDYDNNMTIYISKDMPGVSSPQYLDALSKFLVDIHIASCGSILSLFTNRKEMEISYEYVKDEIKQYGLNVMCQKWATSKKTIMDNFLTEKSLSLFALKSFWEGFDAPGSTLRGVCIPKLPFAVPTNPLTCARQSLDKSAWYKYVLPQSIIETKQAVGRLIRAKNDRGFVVFCDNRLISKSYGLKFIHSMPSKNIKILKCDDIVKDINYRYSV